MKLLVTGGAGFIGSNFIRYWRREHPVDEIINLDLLTYAGNLENLSGIKPGDRYQFLQGDISDSSLVSELIKECDLVVNFAAESHVDRSIEDSADFIKTNVEGTRVLLEAIRRASLPGGRRVRDIRFHHVSTDEVFGSLNENDSPFNEDSHYDPRSPYSASKAASDHLVRAYHHTYGLSVTISNCSNNYGPYQNPEKLIPLFITNLLLGKKLPLYGDGLNIRDWIHVDDHNRGLDMIIHQGQPGQTYCLGGAAEKSNREITALILEIMGHDESMIEYVNDRPGHDKRYAIDFSKARRDLAWEPRMDFMDGLRETVRWYRDNESWWKKIKK